MMFLYMDFSDGTDMLCSELICEGGKEYVEVHFERAKNNGIDSARCRIPEYKWLFNNGYSGEDLAEFIEIIQMIEKDIFEASRKAAQGLINEEGNYVYHIKPV